MVRNVGAVGFDFTESALNDDVDDIEQTAMTAKVVALLSRVFISPVPHRTPKSGRIQM